MVYGYMVLVISWYSLSKIYPELTRWFEVYVPVSTTAPVCCSAIDRNVKLCAVEHKKLRIRQNLLYAKM